MVYQEQIMKIAQDLAGYSLGDADLLRRAMGKKKRAELEKQKQGFIAGAIKNGIAKDIAAGIFLKIEPFAEYGFNKSHAAAYAIWTLVTCWIAWSVIGGLFGGIRVSEEEETQGLDIGEHAMEAYPDFASAK